MRTSRRNASIFSTGSSIVALPGCGRSSGEGSQWNSICHKSRCRDYRDESLACRPRERSKRSVSQRSAKAVSRGLHLVGTVSSLCAWTSAGLARKFKRRRDAHSRRFRWWCPHEVRHDLHAARLRGQHRGCLVFSAGEPDRGACATEQQEFRIERHDRWIDDERGDLLRSAPDRQ